jgi:hypothetical protein
MTDRLIMDYVHEERARCASLAKALDNEQNFLIYCIENSVCVFEIPEQRKRFTEFPDAVTDDFEDLM